MFNKNVQKFCLLTTQRSGSSWLRSLLDSHINAQVYGEIFLYKKPKLNNKVISFVEYSQQSSFLRPYQVFRYLNVINTTDSDNIKAIGFKLMYDQLLRKPEILLKLIIDQYKIIHLVRNNYLDTIISYELAKQNNLFHTRSNVKMRPIYLDVNNIISILQKQKRKVNIAKKLLRVIPNKTLEVSYENLKINKDKILTDILFFLGLPENENINLSSELIKINDKLYQETIINYEQIVNVLENSGFSGLLNI